MQTGVKGTQFITHNNNHLSGVTSNIPPESNSANGIVLSADTPNSSTAMVTPTNAAMKGVIQNRLTADTSQSKAVTPFDMNPTIKSSDLTSCADVVTPGNTTQNENETALPDLAMDKEYVPAIPAIPSVIANNKEIIMPVNASEFEFSPLSSEEDNENKIPDKPK